MNPHFLNLKYTNFPIYFYLIFLWLCVGSWRITLAPPSLPADKIPVQGVGYKINPACFQGKATVVLTKRSCGSALEWGSPSRYWSPSRCVTSPARNAGSGTRATTPPDEHFRHPRGHRGPSHHRRPASFSARPRREASRGRTTSPYNAETRWLMAPLYLDRADVQPRSEGIDLCPIFPLLPPPSPIFFLPDFSPFLFFATYVQGGSLKYLNNVSREICSISKKFWRKICVHVYNIM